MTHHRLAFAIGLIALTLVACDGPSAGTSAEMIAGQPPMESTAMPSDQAMPRGAAPVATSEVAASDVDGPPPPVDGELSAERAFQRTLPTADHPTWTKLRATTVAIDDATQLYTANHPAEVLAMSGSKVTVRGYMLPLEAAERTTHFLVSPYTPVCFFHPPAEPNEVVEVRTSRPIETGYHLVEVTGAFSLLNNGEKGLFFQLEESQARIVERVTG